MKTVIAAALVALGLFSTAAQASEFRGYADWARTAFEQGQKY